MSFIKRYKFSIFLIVCALGVPALVCLLDDFRLYPVYIIGLSSIMIISVTQFTDPTVTTSITHDNDPRTSNYTYAQSLHQMDQNTEVMKDLSNKANQDTGKNNEKLSIPSLTDQVRISGFIVLSIGILSAIVVYGIL